MDNSARKLLSPLWVLLFGLTPGCLALNGSNRADSLVGGSFSPGKDTSSTWSLAAEFLPDSLHEPVLESRFQDHTTNHNMHIASDGAYYYTVNGGSYRSGRIKRFTLQGVLVDSCLVPIDFRSLMYSRRDSCFYGAGFESDWHERNIYKITGWNPVSWTIVHRNLYDHPEQSPTLSFSGEFIYALHRGTLKKYVLATGTLVQTLDGMICGVDNYGGGSAIAADEKYLYSWNAATRRLYVYEFDGSPVREIVLSEGNNGMSLSCIDGLLFVSREGNQGVGTWFGFSIRRPAVQTMAGKN